MKLLSCLFLFVFLISGLCLNLQSSEQNIVFYKYQRIDESIDIGKVFNLGHDIIRYTFKSPQTFLTLNETTGVLRTTSNSRRTFNFDVVMNTLNEKVIETKVNLELKIITVDLIKNSGSFQIQGLTSEAFIDNSRKESVIKSLAKYLTHKITNTAESCNVFNLQNFSINIFSIVQNKNNNSILNVRFFATSSNDLKTVFYHQHQIHWILLEDQETIEKLFHMKITTVNIDECLKEGNPCVSSCFNNITSIKQSTAISEMHSSFQGIDVNIKPVCDNQDFGFFNDQREKTKAISLNNVCPIFYPPINPSESFTMSLSVYPSSTNGIILYFGQKYIQLHPNVKDFLLLQVVNGHPILVIDAGSGEKVISSKCTLTLQQKNIIFIIFDKRKIEMIVQNSNSSTCSNTVFLEGESEVLNINTPIQIGAANQNIFKKLKSYVLNAKISHFYISNFNREDIKEIKPDKQRYSIFLQCLIGMFMIFVIGLLLIINKCKNMINKLSQANRKETLVVSYDNSKETVGVTSLKTLQNHQQNGKFKVFFNLSIEFIFFFTIVEVLSSYSNAKDIIVDDCGIYTNIPYDHSAEVIKSYDAAFKNRDDYDNPSIYAEISENL